MIDVDPIKAAVAVLLLLVLGFGGCQLKRYGDSRFDAGKADVQARWDAAVERGRKEVERLKGEAGKVTIKTEVVYRDRTKTIREKGDAIIQEVPVFVSADSPDLSGGFRLLHDAAAANGPVPDAADIADAASVPTRIAASTVFGNYARYFETAQRLTSLQDWVYAQCTKNPPPEGCVAPY